MTERRITQGILGAGISVAAMILTLFLVRWDFYYDSDYAMISLIAKRIADLRDFPIFVYKVGYQGLIFDGLGTAAVFKFLGMGPHTANLFEILCTAGFFAIFYLTIRKTEGPRMAAWALLFIAFSCPNFYGRLARPQPNYAHTFLLGMLFIWLYLDLLKKPQLKWVFAMGLVAGFGYYTYQMIILFLAATTVHAFMVGLQARPIGSDQAWKEWLLPRRAIQNRAIRWALNGVAGLSITTLFLTILGYAGTHELHLGTLPVLWDPTQTLALTLGLWGLQHAANLFRWHRWIPWGLAGFAIGFSPKLYYNLILKQPSAQRTALGGDLPTLLTRAGYAFKENLRFLNLTDTTLVQGTLIILAGALMVWGIRPRLAMAIALIRGKGSRKDCLKVSPIIFLLPLVFLGFTLSSAVVHVSSSRYTLPNWVFFAFALAAGWQRLPRSPRWRMLTLALLAVFWINTVLTYRNELRALENPHPHLAVRDWLEKKGVREGYADYWIAYSLNFLSNERLTFEPLYSNYIPDYGAKVAPLARIAYVDNNPPRIPTASDGTIVVDYREYQVVEQARIGKYSVQILKQPVR